MYMYIYVNICKYMYVSRLKAEGFRVEGVTSCGASFSPALRTFTCTHLVEG